MRFSSRCGQKHGHGRPSRPRTTRESNARDMTAGHSEDDETTLAIVREIFSERIPFTK